MKYNQDIYKLYSCCTIVSGFLRDSVYDLQRETFFYMPKSFKKNYIKNNFIKIDSDENKEFVNYLIERDLVFKIDSEEEVQMYSDIELEWDFPNVISNVLVDYSNNIQIFLSILNVVQKLNVKNICVRIYSYNDFICFIEEINHSISNSTISSIDFYIDSKQVNHEVLYNNLPIPIRSRLRLIKEYGNLNEVEVGSTPYFLIKTKQQINDKSFIIEKHQFSVNISVYTESLHFNNFYNRKLYIDSKGNLKNSPEITDSFGLIHLMSISEIKEILSTSSFQKYWEAKKDNIEVCRDCEYRYMCIDKCPIIKKDNGVWYRQYECNYNPYICKWNDEEGFLTLEDCGVINNEYEFSIDHNKIEEINKKLWDV